MENLNTEQRLQGNTNKDVKKFQKHLQPGKSENFIWDASAFSGGIYYYQAKLNDGKTVTGKLVKL